MLTVYKSDEIKLDKTIGAQVTTGQYERFGEIAAERGMTRSALGRWVIENWMAEQDADPED